jgi:hypothetical protein
MFTKKVRARIGISRRIPGCPIPQEPGTEYRDLVLTEFGVLYAHVVPGLGLRHTPEHPAILKTDHVEEFLIPWDSVTHLQLAPGESLLSEPAAAKEEPKGRK